MGRHVPKGAGFYLHFFCIWKFVLDNFQVPKIIYFTNTVQVFNENMIEKRKVLPSYRLCLGLPMAYKLFFLQKLYYVFLAEFCQVSFTNFATIHRTKSLGTSCSCSASKLLANQSGNKRNSSWHKSTLAVPIYFPQNFQIYEKFKNYFHGIGHQQV